MSLGSVCLWEVVLAFMVLDESISAPASKWLSQCNCSATSPLLVPGIIASASVPLSLPALLLSYSLQVPGLLHSAFHFIIVMMFFSSPFEYVNCMAF